MKQVARVLEAIENGCRTSPEVAELTGLSKKHAAAYLSVLAQDGLITRRKTPKTKLNQNKPGVVSYWYEPIES